VRLFLAINLALDVRRDILDATMPLRDIAPELSWLDEPRLHLTLKFLGEQQPERLAAIESTITAVAARHRGLVMTLGGVGAFPNFRRARIVWMGVEQDPRLELLHHDVEVAYEALGFELEGRPFRPHLTLARAKHTLPEEQLRKLARAARRIDYRTECIVQSVDLMQSELLPAGAAYRQLVAAPLRSD
jgi:2'-5' RNA ligase